MEKLIIFQTHIEYSYDNLSFQTKNPTVTIYGNRKQCCSPIKIIVNDFLPYFYVKTSAVIDPEELKQSIGTHFTKAKCIGVEKVTRQSVYGYSESPELFFKVYFNTPTCFSSARTMFENGLNVGGTKAIFRTFESNFNFVLRFMNDLRLTGMCYISIENYEKISDSVISTACVFIKPLPLENEYNKLLPFKILSFDIECCGESNSFPSSNKDPVIQIGNTISHYESEKLEKYVFCLKETGEIPDSTVYWFETEEELLKAWRDFFIKQNPDIVTGYNIKGFDFPYIFERAEILGIKDFGRIGRSDKISKVINKQQSSNGFGTFDAKEITIDGILIFDLLHVIRRDHKLRSYTLNSVSIHFLNEQKEDVPYSSMYDLQHGDKHSRARIASYCLRDSYLPLKLLDKLNILVNYSELARATFVPVEYFSTRGAAIKVLSQIYREASHMGYIIPDLRIDENSAPYEGGFVMDPLRGFYKDPIAVLDFSSLYPSIMISKNLCYTTLLTKEQYEKFGGIKTPTNNYFCSAETKEGLLPKILKNLIKKRKETKAELKSVTDPALKKSLDGRQLALKICANSIYGFTGSPSGQLPCIEISQSTTAFGRDMINFTKRLIEDNFCKKAGFSHDSQVIYGDTDSVMVNFFEQDLNVVFAIADKVSKFVSDRFEKPVSLEFEKVYNPYFLINKKRYAGLIYTNPSKPDKIDTKGIETVRRDNCELVKTVIETCLKKTLLEKDLFSAQNFVKEIVRDLYMDRVDLSQLVISKTYTKNNYATKQAHTELAERLRKRGIVVGIGDRVPYIIVKGDKKMAAYEKSEDPVYVLENNLPIDKEYYIEQQLFKPVQRLFEPVMDNVRSLFEGEHTKVIKQNTTLSGPLNAFFATQDKCIGCNKPGTIICNFCRTDFGKHYVEIINQLNERSKTFNECWAECQRCQGSLVNEVLCINTDCPIFYRRTKIKKEMENTSRIVQKLNSIQW